ncbi:GLPGLI family protein [Polaribacter cellanae]|uniref:GLPGLI family protein n=1 Tax=Polaribacter cellanae TaxID=2818493 RepID=A0A975H5I2_9FLAO|nr:GLPGLI family protein [Polaribacter cellanae]QTE21422.1 GLPGLI family protein [Polaribacter cellanae]
MKNIRLYSLSVVLFITFNLFSQKKFTYSFSYPSQKEPTVKSNKKMLLFTNNQNSIFISEIKLKIDSLRKVYSNNRYLFIEKKKQLKKEEVSYIIEKRISENSYTYYNKYAFEKYQYKDNLPELKWQITKESKNILGYKCFLAKTSFSGRNYNAWFSYDIPLSDGPYKFTGLPGLILEIYDTEKVFKFLLIGIEKGNFKIFNKKDYKVIKKEQETKLKQGVEQFIINRAIGNSKRLIKNRIKEKKEISIPIELKEENK